MAELAIKGHKTRGKEVIALLEMLGGKNELHLTGCEMSDCYHIIKGGVINNGYVYPEGFASFTLEEFEEGYPFKVGDEVDCILKDTGVCKIVCMKWMKDVDEVLYYVQRETEYGIDSKRVYVQDLRPYNPEPVETSPDKAKAPSLEGQDYSEGRCGYKIPEGFEFDKVENGEIILKPKKKEFPKTYKECCEVLGIDHNLYLDLNHGDISGEYKPNVYTQNIVYLFNKLYMVLICRDAYWMLADDWKPCWNGYYGDSGLKYCIFQHGASLMRGDTISRGCILMFPTAEMRDTFYENFENLIWECKELL